MRCCRIRTRSPCYFCSLYIALGFRFNTLNIFPHTIETTICDNIKLRGQTGSTRLLQHTTPLNRITKRHPPFTLLFFPLHLFSFFNNLSQYRKCSKAIATAMLVRPKFRKFVMMIAFHSPRKRMVAVLYCAALTHATTLCQIKKIFQCFYCCFRVGRHGYGRIRLGQVRK